jgi:integrase
MLVKKSVDLNNGEEVKALIASKEWSNSTKSTVVAAYNKYAVMNGIKWNPPRYEKTKKLPFIPLEKEIDDLIAYCGRKTSTILQLLKETGMRIGEALDLEWTDVDFERNTILLNTPGKHGNARAFEMSDKLQSMLKRLPKRDSVVFGKKSKHSVICNFSRQRKFAAVKLSNPRLLKIHFHTFRHWKATMEYQRTKDILYVMRMLGHKSIQNTLVYTQMVQFKKEEYASATASTIEDAQKLVEAGFEYVTEMDGVKLFRKRK